MKRMLRTSVFCMGYNRSKARQLIGRHAENIAEHLIKCIVYKNSTGDLHHWIYDELATWLNSVNNVRYGSKKLKVKDYEECTFWMFGSDEYDARCCLEMFISKYCVAKQPRYPHFEVTNSLVDTVYTVFRAVKRVFSEYFSKSLEPTRKDVMYSMLHTILAENCKQENNT